MNGETKTAQGDSLPVKHTQTVMAELLPTVVDHMDEITRAKPGQPTKRTPELIEDMCLRLMRGSSLLMVCQREDMPGYSTVMRWCKDDPDLLAQFDSAREMTAYTIDEFNEIIARGIAPYSTGDYRRDEMLVGINNQRKRHLNRKRFVDKVQMDVVQHQPVILDLSVIQGPGGDGV